MSKDKKEVRAKFRLAVFTRDQFKCRGCGKQGFDHNNLDDVVKNRDFPGSFVELDVHHITDRNSIPAGGYVKENGISLCPACHVKAENPHMTDVEFQAENLYNMIGSSKNNAYMASLELEKKLNPKKRKPRKKKTTDKEKASILAKERMSDILEDIKPKDFILETADNVELPFNEEEEKKDLQM